MRKYVCTTLAVATGILLALAIIHALPSRPPPPRTSWADLQRDLFELSQSTGLRVRTRLLKPEKFVAAANQLHNDLRLIAPADLPPPPTIAQIRKVSDLADLCHECADAIFHPSKNQDEWYLNLRSAHNLLLAELPVAIKALDDDLAALDRTGDRAGTTPHP